MKTVNLTPTWKAATRILIACLKDGDSAEAKQSAEDELMRMADALDTINAGDFPVDNPENDSWFVSFAGGEYEIAYCNTRPHLSPKWFVIRKNDMAQSERFYSWPDGAFRALCSGAIKWSK